jgi:hypothetical protein
MLASIASDFRNCQTGNTGFTQRVDDGVESARFEDSGD